LLRAVLPEVAPKIILEVALEISHLFRRPVVYES
jgi:hypothetical protein